MKEMIEYEREVVITNKARCLKCGQIVESHSRHDYRTCGCGNLSVDGGTEYIRRSFKDVDYWEELSETYTEKVQREKYDWEK